MKKTAPPDPNLLLILNYLARLRSMTADQAARFCAAATPEHILGVLEQAVADKYLASMEVQVPVITEAVVRNGLTKTRPIVIYFLASAGKRLLKQHCPFTRFLKTTRPIKAHFHRLFHDLMIVEALLYFEWEHTVLRYLVEDDLRAMREVAVADLRVVLDNKRGGETIVNCEILVQNSRQDIENKSDDLFWITPTLRQADTVLFGKKNLGVKVLQLQDEREVFEETEPPANDAERELITALNLHGGALTALGVATYLDRDRAYTNHQLVKMVRGRRLFRSSVHRNPGKQVGGPAYIYSQQKSLLQSLKDRILALQISNAMVSAARRRMRVIDVDRDTRVVTATDGKTEQQNTLTQITYA